MLVASNHVTFVNFSKQPSAGEALNPHPGTTSPENVYGRGPTQTLLHPLLAHATSSPGDPR